MKKIFIIVAVIFMAASCGNSGQQQQENQAAAAMAKQATIDSVNAMNEKQKTIDSLKDVATEKETATSSAKEDQPVAVQPVAATPEQRKKGWNSTTKGAVIGTGAGAITGALISKHKGTGALVGGILGAGVGAGTGAIIDDSKKKKEQNQ